ncbi:hypothetical protein AB0F15_31420 [Amycolatopsis sp. NPDC026612]|uniref:hypothetical protein n=1 Tax=Amycolatopsis sp. NPDC026612 TaxID=3155466 RepID=UPI0033DE9F42
MFQPNASDPVAGQPTAEAPLSASSFHLRGAAAHSFQQFGHLYGGIAMTSNQPSRRTVLRSASGMALAAGATLLGGRALASPAGAAASPHAAQAIVNDKVTWWDATSVAGPAAVYCGLVPSANAYTTAIAWRGNQNSSNLTVANVMGPVGRFTGSVLQKTILNDYSGNAPAFAPKPGPYGLRMTWSGTNGGRSINFACLSVYSTGTPRFAGEITRRELVAGNLISCTTGPTWGYSALNHNQIIVTDQYGQVVAAEQQTDELTFTVPITQRFLTNPRGAVHSWYDGSLGTYWVWTASDGTITFASVDANGAIAVVRSAQSSQFAPSDVAYSYASNQLFLAWTTTSGRIALAPLFPDAVKRGADPIGAVNLLAEQSLAAPALLARYSPSGTTKPAFDLFWTGIDGTGALNAAVITF